MRRREFIAGLGGAAVWTLAARAQQGDRVRRIGVLMGRDENDPVQKAIVSALTQALADLGWTVGRNVRMDFRVAGGDSNRMPARAQELVGLQPDIIVTGGGVATAALQRATATIPIVFATLGDRERPRDCRAAEADDEFAPPKANAHLPLLCSTATIAPRRGGK